MVRDGNFDTPTVNDAFMIMFSAGNSGPNANTLTSPKEAKNPISVAASRNQRVGSVADIVGFSSRGPSVDGRMLPTITAPGEQIASTRRIAGGTSCGTAIAGTTNNYSFCSGTSMASPHAAGFAALLTQWYRANNSGATPSPALVKALMINGAIDMAGPAAIPNTSEGWGRINFQNSVATGKVLVDQTDLLTEVGASNIRVFSAIDAAKPVRITLVWTDAPGAIAANPAQVNDLDLLVDSGANTYLGNVFTAGQSSAGGTPDRKNNAENVYLPAGTAAFTVTVRAQNLPGDGVPNLGDATDQDYALVCSNCISEPTFTMAAASDMGGSLCSGDNTYTPINLAAILGFQTPVQLSSNGLPAGATISFSNTTIAPNASALATLSLSSSVAAGTSSFNIVGAAGAVVRSITYPLRINTLPAAAPALALPIVDAVNVNPANLTLTWTAGNTEPSRYRVMISNSPTMTPLLASVDVDGTSYIVPTSMGLSSNTSFYWSVAASSACGGLSSNKGFENSEGSAASSLVRSFKTAVAPGDCPATSITQSVFSDNVEGTSAFTASGTGGTWAVTSAFPFAGTKAWQAVGPNGVSDLRLDSSPITLPAVAQGLLLRFHDRQSFEDNTATSCYDGGIVEISVAGGPYTQITTGLLTSPYTGNVTAATNPLNGKPAWCGDPRPYLRNVIDLAPYAGQSVNIRFRSGSDSSQGRPEGWNIDNIEVVSCQ